MISLDSTKNCPECHGAGFNQIFKKRGFSLKEWVGRISEDDVYIATCTACGCNNNGKGMAG